MYYWFVGASIHNEASKEKVSKAAVKEKLDALQKNDTWELNNLPKGAKPISWKWIYKVKRNVDGSISKHKARLVAKGYLQVFSLNYNDSFALVSNVVIAKILLTLAPKQNWIVHQIDINNAFLRGHLEEDA